MIDRRETAYHEAGHVVATYVEALALGDASIAPDEGREAHVSGEDGDAESAIIVNLAGLAAARLVLPGRGVEEGGAGGDYEKANELLTLVDADLETLEARAAELVAKHRPLVDAIATLLLEEEYVIGGDLEFVCCAVEEGENWRDTLSTYRQRFPLTPEHLQVLSSCGIKSVRGQPSGDP